MEIRFW